MKQLQGPFSPAEIFNGRNLFFVGGTGFLGKVTLSMLLERYPQIGKIYLMVRAGSGDDSEERFWNNIFASPAFDPLRNRYREQVQDYLKQKLIIVGGDITQDNLGYTEQQAQQIANDVDIVLNSSGNVSFNPPLETALKTNVTGTRNLLTFVKRMRNPRFVHTSTCFVAGNRSGQVWEDDPLIGYFPRREELKDVEFSVEKEIKDCERLTRSVVEEAEDATLNAEFRTTARKRLIEEGRDPDEGNNLSLAAARERKDWIRSRMSELGLQRAKWWGWPNIYTYTKSMGEQMIAAETGITRAIVRPAIVESSVVYPFAGWNEGFNTTAPLILFALKGQNEYPVNPDLILDVIPVDFVSAALLAVTAQTIVETPKLVHQLCTGDVNPARMRRTVTLLGLYKRQHFKNKEDGNRFLNALGARMEARPVSDEYFRRIVPYVHKKTIEFNKFLSRQKTYGTLSGLIQSVKKGVDHLEAFLTEGLDAYDQFRPFMVENLYRFRADNVRTLFARLSREDSKQLIWAPEKIDWYHYWLKVHFPGLQKWVFPKMEEIGKPKPKRVYTYRSLMEMFHSVTKLHRDRVAMRIQRKGVLEEYSYGNLAELVTRAAAFLHGQSVTSDDRIGLIGENSPEWGIAYFGIIKAGAICIPMDKDLNTDEIVNLLSAGKAKGIVVSERIQRKHSKLAKKLSDANLDVKTWTLEEVFELGDEQIENDRASKLPKPKPTGIASLIFTSGTTGKPKGVMLTQKNLTSMMTQLLKVYDVTNEDGFLSVLPLHHTFEFSTGFLLPISRGAQITYLEELSGEVISDAFKTSHVTIMVGVPALWDLLRRRILSKFGDKSEKLESFVKGLININKWVREKTSLNVGPFLFFPIHKGLGGNIRYLISGGSALSEKTYETFYGLGFSLNEGYGLTESSPVLTVTRPGAKPKIGSVGEALPGVEIKISDANEHGIGEVLARGPNIMAGYYENKEATDATIIDGWLHTGDLGYVDSDGNLFLVGRSKDLIVGSSGKNVYPDEIEEAYRHHKSIKELSIVGLPDESGERIACLVVPDYDYDSTLTREQVHGQIEEHFRQISAELPVWKRVNVMEFYEKDLPRTGTRKVKRREVIGILQNLLAHQINKPLELSASEDIEWLAEIISNVCGRPAPTIDRNTTFDELGFDSLMYTELGAAIEASGRTLPSFNGLSAITNVKELAEFLKQSRLPAKVSKHAARKSKESEEIVVPKIIADSGRKGLDLARHFLYRSYMDTEIKGEANIPYHTNFIVAANHCSHLDMGLVKTALGDAGKNMVAVAAADYFFDNKYKKAFFDNFTDLIPIERKGSLHESLKLANHYLEGGYNLLIFPEGTRSVTGKISEFKFSLGYLGMRTHRGILPIYLGGTFDAMPKGSNYPKSAKISANIAPLLAYDDLAKLVEGIHKNDAYRLITSLVQRVVEQMRDGLSPAVNFESVRRQWQREHQPQIEKASVMGD
ncbi:MAG: AMP-dependent synthetase [Acidobacteria bacterium]|nr:MAG: AMP-dependent synthetase [Acidobacteriota bacterium]